MILGEEDSWWLAILRIAKSYFTIWNTDAEHRGLAPGQQRITYPDQLLKALPRIRAGSDRKTSNQASTRGRVGRRLRNQSGRRGWRIPWVEMFLLWH